MVDFLNGNEWYWLLARTVAQGVIGVVIANLDLIVGWCVMDPSVRALVVALVMAVLFPVMAELGGGDAPVIERGTGRGGDA